MGYRSNVSLVFYTTNRDNIPFATIKLWFDENYPIQEAKHDWDAKITYGDDYVLVEYEDVKWWDGASHVGAVKKAIVSFTNCFSADEPDMGAWEMSRTGEQHDDVEEDRSDYSSFRLFVSRQIVFG